MIENINMLQWGPDTLLYTAGIADVAESDPGLFVFMMIFALGAFVSAVVCCLLILLAGILMAGIAATGIVSVSILTGFYRRSLRAGWKMFWLLGGFFLGASVALLIYAAICYFSRYEFSGWYYIAIVIPAGTAGGLLAVWAARILLKRFVSRAIKWFRFLLSGTYSQT
jgi:hypothetical protein